VALEANGDLVNRSLAPTVHILQTLLQEALEKRPDLVQLIPSTCAKLRCAPWVRDVKVRLPPQPLITCEKIGSTVPLDGERFTVQMALRRHRVHALQQQHAMRERIASLGHVARLLVWHLIRILLLEVPSIANAVFHLLVARL
jgi:hypothetical protein